MDDLKIVFSDVDGTLLDSRQEITPRTLRALKLLQKKEIPFVIISARSPSGIEPIVRKYGLRCSIVSYSGSLILNEERQIIYHRGMSRAEAAKILDFTAQQHFDMAWGAYSFDQWVTPDRTDPRIEREERIVKATAQQGVIADMIADEVHKLLFICAPAWTDTIEATLRLSFRNTKLSNHRMLCWKSCPEERPRESREKDLRPAGYLPEGCCCLWG